MVRVVFHDDDGNEHELEGASGESLMRVGFDNLVPGIIAECGGWCACATCMVEVDDEWSEKLQPPAEDELTMIDASMRGTPRSRLSCQIELHDGLEGLEVKVRRNG